MPAKSVSFAASIFDDRNILRSPVCVYDFMLGDAIAAFISSFMMYTEQKCKLLQPMIRKDPRTQHKIKILLIWASPLLHTIRNILTVFFVYSVPIICIQCINILYLFECCLLMFGPFCTNMHVQFESINIFFHMNSMLYF